ncbi:restriction endonuclease subunit S [Martelella sp. FLE1502]
MSREMPEGWTSSELGAVLSVLRNGFSCNQSVGGDTPVSRIETIADGFVNSSRFGFTPWDEKLSKYRVERGDIFFSHINSPAHIGKTAIFSSDEVLYHGMNLMLMRADRSKILPEYLLSVLRDKAARSYFRSSCRPAVNQASLSKSIISSFSFLLPPLEEQRRIAEILSGVDEAIAATLAVIEQTRKVKQGILQRLLSRGIGHTRFRQTEIGEIPEGWEVGPLSRFGKVYTGKTPSTSDDEAWGGDTPFVTPGDLSDERAIVVDSSRYVSEHGTRRGRVMPAGAVAVTCIGSTVGKTGILNEPCMTNQQINTICCREEVSLFVYETCISLRSYLQRISGKQAVPIVNKSTFENILVAHPTLEEQIEISKIALEIEKNLKTQLNTLKRLSLLKSALMSDLLTGRKRVTDALPVAAE